MNNKTIIAFIVGVVLMFFLMKSCESEPSIKTETTTTIEPKKEDVKEAELKDVKIVYIDTTKPKTKWLKGETKTVYRDTIIYKDKPSETTVEAKEYKTELRSNNATANITITANELYKVEGVITYPKVTENTTTTITRDASGFYIYGSMPISSQITTPELGVMLQIKNKLIIGVGAQYNNFNNNVSAVATIGVKL